MDNNVNKIEIEQYVSNTFNFFWGDGTGQVSKELIKKYLILYRKFPEKEEHVLNKLQVMTNYFNKI